MAEDSVADPLTMAARLDALHRLGLLDAPAEAAFERLARLASTALDVPVALVSLVDAERQFFAGSTGLPEPVATQRQTPLSHSFCQHTLLSAEPLVIEDARDHPLVRDNLAIPDLGVIAYLGIPLINADGYTLGSLCAIDVQPRAWTSRDIAILSDLAGSVLTEMELRAAVRASQGAQRDLELARFAAEQTRMQLSAVVQQLPVGMIVVAAPSGEILEYNAQSEAILGHPVIPAVSSGEYDNYGGLHPDGRSYAAEEYPTARALRGERVFEEETLYRRGDGRLVVLSISAVPVTAPDGQTPLVVCTFTDITAIKEQERTRAEMFDEIAHDLKNPLTSIRGQAQLLRRQLARQGGIPAEQLDDRLESIVTATGRARAILDEHLDLARVRAGQPLQLERQPTDLVVLAGRTIAVQQLGTEQHELRLVTNHDTLAGEIDGQRIERMLTNLLSNAIKYSPAGGEIAVSIAIEDDGPDPVAILSVADSGIGIPAAELARIGERFHRASNVAGRFGGTGLGMASVRQVVGAHGGSVAIASVEGAGTMVTVRLPLRAAPDGAFA